MVVNKTSKAHKRKGCWRRSGYRTRGAGNRGGRGKAGWGKRRSHRRQMFLKQGLKPGKRGFVSVKPKTNSVNIGSLLKLVESEKINASKLGFQKVLGKGVVDRKINLTARAVTETAKQKIIKAGGTVKTEQEN